jgi:hypothetical protein
VPISPMSAMSEREKRASALTPNWTLVALLFSMALGPLPQGTLDSLPGSKRVPQALRQRANMPSRLQGPLQDKEAPGDLLHPIRIKKQRKPSLLPGQSKALSLPSLPRPSGTMRSLGSSTGDFFTRGNPRSARGQTGPFRTSAPSLGRMRRPGFRGLGGNVNRQAPTPLGRTWPRQ